MFTEIEKQQRKEENEQIKKHITSTSHILPQKISITIIFNAYLIEKRVLTTLNFNKAQVRTNATTICNKTS